MIKSLLTEPESYAGCSSSQHASTILASSSSHGSLFLGSSAAAKDEIFLKENNISFILTAADDVIVSCTTIPEHNYRRLMIKDSTKFSILPFLPEAHTFIHDALVTQQANVLVHCSAGVSRSATVVISFLMKLKKWSLIEAASHTRGRRKFVYPNKRFWVELTALEQELLGKSSITPADIHEHHADQELIKLQQ